MDIESELRLDEDAAAVAAFLVENDGLLQAGWRPGNTAADGEEVGVYWLTMRPRSDPTTRYVVRVGWIRYPGAQPSVKFAKGVRGALSDRTAWPQIPGYRPDSFDICAEWTAEGLALHAEWAGRWRTTGNPFLWIAEILQGDLDRKYAGNVQ